MANYQSGVAKLFSMDHNTLCAFHLPRSSGNSGWGVNGTHVFRAFHWKIPGNKRYFENVVLFSRWKLSGGNACYIYEFSRGITSSRLFTAISVSVHLEFWWREHERIELMSNGKRSSLDGPFHGSFSKFLVKGKRPMCCCFRILLQLRR